MAPSNAEWELLMTSVPRTTSRRLREEGMRNFSSSSSSSSISTPAYGEAGPPSMNASSSLSLLIPPDSSISSILRQKTLAFVAACNVHNFDPEHPFYKQNFSPHYKYRGRVMMGEENSISLESWLRTQCHMAAANPGYHVKVLNLDVDVQDVQKGIAQVYMHTELWNVPDGVVRTSILVAEWRRVKERWVCVWTKALPGMAIGDNVVGFG